jgi:putative two-component system response regulator
MLPDRHEWHVHAAKAQTALIVEDQPSFADALARLLNSEGLATSVVLDGESALRSVDDRPPDIVLLDVGLPGLSGLEVCRRIKANTASRLIPVVLVSGAFGRAYRIAAINAGADDFIAKPIDAEELKARVRALLSVKQYTSELESAEAIVISLALMVEARDPYTAGHCERLAQYAGALGEAAGLSSADVTALRRGGYLHDIGKIAIPDTVLLKSAPLTADEIALMRCHPTIGMELCANLQSLAPVLPIVGQHHERLDGSGYPEGRRGGDISLLAQVIAVVDVFDALTTTRPYRPALPCARAYDELSSEVARGRLNADLVHTFIDRVLSATSSTL